MKTETKTQETVVDISKLSADQLKALRGLLRSRAKARTGSGAARNTIVDRMLHEKDASGYKHTTADILAALIAAKIVAPDLTADERAAQLKMIQTRKQKLQHGYGKFPADPNVGYKASPMGVGPLTLERVNQWLAANGYKPATK